MDYNLGVIYYYCFNCSPFDVDTVTVIQTALNLIKSSGELLHNNSQPSHITVFLLPGFQSPGDEEERIGQTMMPYKGHGWRRQSDFRW